MSHPVKLPKKITKRQWISGWTMFGLVCGTLLLAGLVHSPSLASAACANTPDPTKGTDTMTMNVTTAGTYYLWSRILAPDTTNNSYYVQVDGGCAINVGNSSSIPANTWTWVNYQDGNTASITSLSLTSGSHQVVMTGRGAGVGVDRLLFLSDQTCVPTGTGDNCTVSTTLTPTVSLTTPTTGATVAGTVNVTASASESGGTIASVQLKLDGNNLGSPLTVSPYTYSWNTTSTTNGSHTLTAVATDAAGVSATSSGVTVSVSNSTADTTAPSAPSNLQATSTTTNSTLLSWGASTDNVGVTGYHVWRGDANYANWVQVATVSASTLSYTDNSLSPGTSYTYGIRAFDAAGNISASSNTIKVTTTSGDTTAPTVNITAPLTGATVSGTITIAANATDNVGVAKVEFYVNGTLLASDTTSPYSTAWNAGAVANGSYTLTAKAYDASGNVGSASPVSVTVNNPDTTPPSTPANLTATAASSTQVNLAWTASTDNVGVARYNIERGGVVIGTTTTTTYSDTTVSASTAYSYNVVAVDAAGNASALSNTATVTTLAAADTTPPAAPTNLSATVASPTQVNLSWTASTDPSGIKGYNVYRGGVKLTSTPITTSSYGDATASPGTTYSYTVTAIDGAGNQSVQSTPATVTTPTVLGLATVGTSSDTFARNRKRVSSYSLNVANTVASIKIYLAPTSTTGQQVLKGLIYADAGGSPGALLGVTNQLTFYSSNTAGWYAMPFPSPLSLSPGKYWVGIITGDNSYVAGFRYNSVSRSRYYNINTYTSGPTNPFGSYKRDSEQTSLYASNN